MIAQNVDVQFRASPRGTGWSAPFERLSSKISFGLRNSSNPPQLLTNLHTIHYSATLWNAAIVSGMPALNARLIWGNGCLSQIVRAAVINEGNGEYSDASH
jgi:hypothetical protein